MSAKNYNTGKSRPSLVLKDMSKAFEQLLAVREAGSIKYDRLNFRQSIGTDDAPRFLEENIDSILRHLMCVLVGETHDKESGLPHMAHIMCRAGFDLEYLESEAMGQDDTIDQEVESSSGSSPDSLPPLKRQDEMPDWLVDLIRARYDGDPKGTESGHVRYFFYWDATPEGRDFWCDVNSWQQDHILTLPERPRA